MVQIGNDQPTKKFIEHSLESWNYGIDINLLLNMNKLEKLIDIINTTLYYRLLIEDNKLN